MITITHFVEVPLFLDIFYGKEYDYEYRLEPNNRQIFRHVVVDIHVNDVFIFRIKAKAVHYKLQDQVIQSCLQQATKIAAFLS